MGKVKKEVVQMVVINSFVICRRIQPAALITAQECQDCPLFGGMTEALTNKVAQELYNNNKAVNNTPVLDIICKLPTKVRVQRQVREV